MKGLIAFLAAAWMTAAGAFECERLFRSERYGRGDTNIRVQQPIDEVSWVWMPGLDVWGAAVFTVTLPPGLGGDFEWRGARTPLKAGANEI